MSSKKSASGAKSKKAAAVKSVPLPPYGVPIKEAIASGDLRNMKAVASSARKHVADVEKALKTLDAAIAKHKG
ncbi:MAG: DUF1843 domain-containing protein [Blastocatellia bacterium]